MLVQLFVDIFQSNFTENCAPAIQLGTNMNISCLLDDTEKGKAFKLRSPRKSHSKKFELYLSLKFISRKYTPQGNMNLKLSVGLFAREGFTHIQKNRFVFVAFLKPPISYKLDDFW